MAQATIQLGNLVTQIRTIVEDACQPLAAAIGRNCTPARDIAGIRRIALDNAETLWPMANPSGSNGIPASYLGVFGVVWSLRSARNQFTATRTVATSLSFEVQRTCLQKLRWEGLLETTMAALDQQYPTRVFRSPSQRWIFARLPHATGTRSKEWVLAAGKVKGVEAGTANDGGKKLVVSEL